MVEKYANAFATPIVLTSNLSIGGTSVSVNTVAPTALQGGQARLSIQLDPAHPDNHELLLVTAGQNTTTWTVERAVEGTTAVSHASGSTVSHILTAASLLSASPAEVIDARRGEASLGAKIDLLSAGGGGGSSAEVIGARGGYATLVESVRESTFDVRDFGAVGNGVTNDTVALRAAIIASAGAKLIWPFGVYLVTDTLVDADDVSRYSWEGLRSERGAHASEDEMGIDTSAVRILFRPADESKPLVRCYNTADPLWTFIGPFEHRNITFDLGDANGLVFGVDDPANPTTFPANPSEVTDDSGQKYVTGVRFDGCALIASGAERASVAGVITRSGRRIISLTKTFEAVVENSSLYGGDTQVHTLGCDKPTIRNVRSQGSHLPIDFVPSGTFAVQHTIDNLQVEGWTFTPLRNAGVDFAGSNLRFEQNDGAPTGSGRFAIPGTVAVTADSATLTFSQSMNGILFPGLSIVELTDGTNVLTVIVKTVSGATVTFDDDCTVATWSDGAATATRIHGYGPIDFGANAAFTNVSCGASYNTPAFVYLMGRSTMSVTNALGGIGSYGDMRSLIIGNHLYGTWDMQSIAMFNGCDYSVCPPSHPFASVSNLRDNYGTEDIGSVHLPVGGLAEAMASVRRQWAFTPGTTGASTLNTQTDIPVVLRPVDVNTTQQQWAWHIRGGAISLSDSSLPSKVTSRIRVRFMAASVSGTTDLSFQFFGDGGAWLLTWTLTTTPTVYEYVLDVPVAWQTSSDWRGITTATTGGEPCYLFGVTVEELTAADVAGGWTAATGTASRATFVTSTVTTAQLAQRVMALEADLIARGIIGA